MRNLFDLTKHGRGYEYDCVTIAYANSINEFKKLKAYYRAKQYIYIDYEKSYKDINERYKTRQFMPTVIQERIRNDAYSYRWANSML